MARAADNENWRRLTGHVRSTARAASARQGKIVVTRHGKPADPEKFKGVYRLRLPLPGESVAPPQDARGLGRAYIGDMSLSTAARRDRRLLRLRESCRTSRGR